MNPEWIKFVKMMDLSKKIEERLNHDEGNFNDSLDLMQFYVNEIIQQYPELQLTEEEEEAFYNLFELEYRVVRRIK